MGNRKTSATIWLLAAVSAVLLSIPWLLPHAGPVILVAFVPLLMADRIASNTGYRRFWWTHYCCFLFWNAVTTFWVCNANIGGGIFAVVANAFQMSVIWALFRLAKKHMRGVLPYVLLATAWIAWERWYLAGAQISWPWLVLGNAFATNIHLIQWYSATGTLGGSLWAWCANLAVFGTLMAIADGALAALQLQHPSRHRAAARPGPLRQHRHQLLHQPAGGHPCALVLVPTCHATRYSEPQLPAELLHPSRRHRRTRLRPRFPAAVGPALNKNVDRLFSQRLIREMKKDK